MAVLKSEYSSDFQCLELIDFRRFGVGCNKGFNIFNSKSL